MFRYIHNKYDHLKLRIEKYRKRERRLSYGSDNKDKTFYVICYDYDTQGLFAIVKSVLSHIMYALDKGWIPIVDLKNYSSQYQKNGENAWELFFEQPCGYNLDDIKSSKNIIKSYYGLYPYGQYAFYVDILDAKEKWSSIADLYKKYIKPQHHVHEYMDNMKADLDIDNNTLGILCRGTDYLNRKPHNHPRQPEPDMIILDAREFMEKNDYDSIFVATEDEQVLNMFKKEFGESLKYVDQPRLTLNSSQQYLSDVKTESSTRYKMALDYYTALYILSKCPAIIAGRTAGTLGAVFMSEGYEYSHFYDLGYYE